MVYCGEIGEKVTEAVMAMVPERSKPPLHNFELPFLKWGNQRHLRCMKLPADSNASTANNEKSSTIRITIPAADRHRRNRSPPSKFLASWNLDARRFKQLRRFDVSDSEEGIQAVGEKMILDLKTAADRMKDEILGKRVSDDEDEEEEQEEGEEQQSPAPAPMEQEVRPWNLRTRRAACKAPMVDRNSVTGKGLRIEERKGSNSSPLRSDSAKSPRLRAEKIEKEDKEKEKEKERVRFSVGLSKAEVEKDFMKLVGHRPPRRPKKRPRIVQRQLDMLFPGLWLTEVTVDAYKVQELPDGKR